MSKLDRPMPSVSLAGDTDGTERQVWFLLDVNFKLSYVPNIELYMDLYC